jgi:ion channel
MQRKTQSRWDLFLLLSLLSVILMYPVLNRGDVSRLFLGVLLFTSLISATVKLSQIKTKVWPLVVLMSGAFTFALIDTFSPNRLLTMTKWGFLTVFFGLSVAGLFTFLKNSRSIKDAHLYTAVSIYLLIGMQWFALYSAIDAARPGAYIQSAAATADRQTELLYFSLVTLSTLGYGDIVPIHGEVRILAALEAITGVLYIAITVALLVSSYKQHSGPGEVAEVANEIK